MRRLILAAFLGGVAACSDPAGSGRGGPSGGGGASAEPHGKAAEPARGAVAGRPAATASRRQQGPATAARRSYIEIPEDAPFTGPKNAKVTVLAFLDYECPFSARAAPTLNRIAATYPDDVKLVVRQLPMGMHPTANLSAQAALAAAAQGKFWGLHDKMFAGKRALGIDDLLGYAEEVGLDVSKFREALETGKYKSRIEEDKKAAMSIGSNSTPVILVNGARMKGDFLGEIPGEIQRANEELAKGTPPDQLYAKLAGKE